MANRVFLTLSRAREDDRVRVLEPREIDAAPPAERCSHPLVVCAALVVWCGLCGRVPR